ncbi:hypothetical protein GOP47_0021299 [Adiantum capillus-veneris]|uniref:Protein kinase domain-containing protein n=1 Tax=Adiantum capillus-veneris TaxID=13818 RepID=A0A9D4Z7R3_ADICA|nr:hypothetical protein GOP47_0021299 [Adiantum capillus-veneris]
MFSSHADMASSLLHISPSCGRWLRGSSLGSGSFGNVSLGLSLDDGLLFAVKSAPASPAAQALSLQNEFHILHALHSPRIVRCLGASLTALDDTPCFSIFLEYMEEGTIADLVKKSGGRLEEGRARECTRAILEGLCYLHKQGVVHCDIKGQNILLGSRGEIKIADFGSARKVSSRENSESCSMRGTPLWMAPEVVQGVEQGTPSDIWSLGCTLVEMLQGRPPWGSIQDHTSPNDLASLLFRIAYTNEGPSLVECLFSAEARDFLSKCLERDPKKRWTAEQLLRHPFVMLKEEGLCSLYRSQVSPRSALDFFMDSDLESESSGSIKSFAYATKLYCTKVATDNEATVREDCGSRWFSVRCTACWSEDRQKPFFRTEKEVIVKKGNQVSLESLGFLARRMRPVVG